MLSRYSHVRMDAKRRALDEIAARRCAAGEKRKKEAEQRQVTAEAQSAVVQRFSGSGLGNAKTTLCARYTAIGDTEWPRRA